MADRRDAANCESGAGPHEGGVGLAHCLPDQGGDLLFIHTAGAAGDDKYAGVVFEPPQHDGFGNLGDIAADLAGRFDCGSGACRELDNAGLDSECGERLLDALNGGKGLGCRG